MNTFISVLLTIILGLIGVNRFQSSKIKTQKKNLENSKNKIKKNEKEFEKISDVQEKIEKVKVYENPKKKKAAEHGDSSSRLDRLNKLHDN